MVSITEREVAGVVCLVAEPAGPARPDPLVFIHGMWEGPLVWRKYLRFFGQRGYRCYAPYLRGYHESHRIPPDHAGKVSVGKYLTELRGVIREVTSLYGGASPACFGHSMGGLLTQKLAAEAETNLLLAVLISTAAPRWFMHVRSLRAGWLTVRHSHQFIFRSRTLPLSYGEMCGLLLNNFPPRLRETVYAKMLPASGLQTWQTAVVGLKVDAAEVRCPVLVVGAQEDRITPARMVYKVARKYRADYYEYAGFAHMIPRERGWERAAEDVFRWVERELTKTARASGEARA